ncbi:hypothetical protein L4C35_00015 [Photobacterium kagoshimensis]
MECRGCVLHTLIGRYEAGGLVEISDVIGVISNERSMSSYNSFLAKLTSSNQFILSKKEKLKIRNFYGKVKSLPVSKRVNITILGELKTLIDSIDFEEAKKRKLKRAIHKRVRKSAKKKSYQIKKPTIEDIIESRKNLPRIGLGLESVITLPKVKSEDVVIDLHTEQKNTKDKHILYVAGWSLSQPEDEEPAS